MTIDKAALRKEMIDRREEMTSIARSHAAGAAAAHAEALLAVMPEVSSPVVSTYWAIGPEMDPVSLEAALVARGASLALPVMVAKGKPLVFRSYAHGDTVAARTWGIHEPLASALAVQPDILLVPLLAADLTGARLGYGGGFYDRTLKELRVAKSIAAVGLCYDEQIVDAVPYLHYDEFLDYLLTPTGVTKCQEA